MICVPCIAAFALYLTAVPVCLGRPQDWVDWAILTALLVGGVAYLAFMLVFILGLCA